MKCIMNALTKQVYPSRIVIIIIIFILINIYSPLLVIKEKYEVYHEWFDKAGLSIPHRVCGGRNY